MKKILLIISVLFSLVASAQRLDTVLVRNLQLRAGDWAYLVSYVEERDSTSIATVQKIRKKIQGTASPNFNTQIVVDSLPGSIVFSMYSVIKNASAGEYEILGNNVSNNIKAVTNSALQYFIGLVDGGHQAEFIRRRSLGKNKLLD